MTIKKIISIGLCTLTLSTSLVPAASAAKSADLNNKQIVDKVKLFNESKLKRLNQYILQINAESPIKQDLINLYQKLDDLIISDINVANEINEPARENFSTSIGSQLERLFSFLDIINREYTQDTFTAEMRASSIIKILNKRLDEISISKDSQQLNFKSKQEKTDHIIAYLHAVIPYDCKYVGIKLAGEINNTFENQTYKNDKERIDHIIAYIHYVIPYELKEIGIKIANEFNQTFA